MKTTLITFLFGVIFVLNYNGYYFNPCKGDVCLAIPGYEVAQETRFCDNLQCVEDTLESTGTEHFKNAYKITYDEHSKEARIESVEIGYRATLKE